MDGLVLFVKKDGTGIWGNRIWVKVFREWLDGTFIDVNLEGSLNLAIQVIVASTGLFHGILGLSQASIELGKGETLIKYRNIFRQCFLREVGYYVDWGFGGL